MSKPVPIGKGILAEVSEDGTTLVLTIDLSQDQGPSYSGKTQIALRRRAASRCLNRAIFLSACMHIVGQDVCPRATARMQATIS
jgi:hypothetical protein